MRKAAWLLIGAVLVVIALVAVVVLTAPPTPSGPTREENISLTLVADGLEHPVAVARAGGITDRVFIVDQVGVVHMLLDNDTLAPGTFLDLRDRMVNVDQGGDERGLLSVAFHPDYETNRRLFAFYSAPLRQGAEAGFDHTNLISEFTASADGLSVDSSTERIVLAIDHPARNHNGGQVLFGPDEFLYITAGDGGGGNDIGFGHNATVGNAQDPNSLHGKVLRIDVDGDMPYGIPEDNPYSSGGGLPEIFALGFRNPAYATFDPVGGGLFVADAGQARYEEVDLVVKGGNFGWRFREGAHCFDPNDPRGDPSSCPSTGVNGEPLIDPIGEFRNSAMPGGEGAAVIGGAVYHGNITAIKDGYVFGAFRSGSPLFVLLPSENGSWSRSSITLEGQDGGVVPGFLLAVATDLRGDILVLSADNAGPSGGTGKVWRLQG